MFRHDDRCSRKMLHSAKTHLAACTFESKTLDQLATEKLFKTVNIRRCS